MAGRIRELLGALLMLVALVLLFGSVAELRYHDYLSAFILALAGLSLVGAGAELLRPSIGE